jgi:hypothetical protein
MRSRTSHRIELQSQMPQASRSLGNRLTTDLEPTPPPLAISLQRTGAAAPVARRSHVDYHERPGQMLSRYAESASCNAFAEAYRRSGSG